MRRHPRPQLALCALRRAPERPSRAASTRAVLGAVLAATLVGCGAHSHGHNDPGPPPGPPVYREIEPNDSVAFPDRIGLVDRYSFLYVEGHVEAYGWDIRDHIEFLSTGVAAYDFRIDALSYYGDVDVTIYDPIAGVVVAEYFFSGPYEVGRVLVHEPNRPFQIIVEAYGVDTEWSLELIGVPYPGHWRAPGEGDAADSEGAGGRGSSESPIEALFFGAAELRS